MVGGRAGFVGAMAHASPMEDTGNLLKICRDGSSEKQNEFQHEAICALRSQLQVAYMEHQEKLMQRFDIIIKAWIDSQDVFAAPKSGVMEPQPTVMQPQPVVMDPQPVVMDPTKIDRSSEASQVCTSTIPLKAKVVSHKITESSKSQASVAVTGITREDSVLESELVHNIHDGRMRLSNLDMSMEELKKTVDSMQFYKRMMGPFACFVEWWAKLEEPRRSGPTANLVQGHLFECVCLVVIIVNTVYTVLDTNYSMAHKTKEKTFLMSTLEIGFTCFYVIEIALKLCVHRLYFFCNSEVRWNLLDTFLVTSGVLELITQSSSNPSFVRMVRVVRIARVFRMVRLLKFFAELRLMLTCVIGSLMSLFWAFFLILAFSVLFAIILVQHMTTYILDSSDDAVTDEFAQQIQTNFGSVQLATFTLFKGISGGDWTVYFAMVSQTGWFNAAVFMVYILFVWLSVTNIITCIFVEKAMKLAQPDIEELLFEKRKAEIESAEHLQKLFDRVDKSQSGSITWEEFERCMHDESITSYLEVNGLTINDAFIFFRMLASSVGSRDIDVNTFVRGCLKMKGVAMNIDLLQLSYEVKIISKSQQHLFKVLEKEMATFCQTITETQQRMSVEMSTNMYHVCAQLCKQLAAQSMSLAWSSPDDGPNLFFL